LVLLQRNLYERRQPLCDMIKNNETSYFRNLTMDRP